MPRGAPARVLEDATEPTGPRIDVAVRIGWVARMARLTAAGGPRTLEQVAAAAGTSTTRLNRLETGQLRAGALLEAYERVLDRAPGSLRAPVDVLCRCFPYAPRDTDPDDRLLGVREVSRLTAAVERPAPTGGDWLAWARAHARPGAVGLPEHLARALLRRLASEVGRSHGHGYATRYEALAVVRCSDYGHLVLEVAQEVVAHPHVQVLLDLLSGVGERPDDDGRAWCLQLLDDPRDRVVVGGALGLENMAQVDGTSGFWSGLVAPLVERANGAEAGSTRRWWLSHLLRLAPADVRDDAPALTHPLEPAAAATTASPPGRAARERDWRDARRRAHAVADDLDLPEQPVLARLLWEIAHSPLETRAVTSYILLNALPALAGPVVGHVAELAETHPEAEVRARCARRLIGVSQHVVPPVVRRWAADPEHDLRPDAVRLLAHRGERLDPDLLGSMLAAHPTHRTAALYALGMTDDPLLPALAADPEHPAHGAAAWWLAEGPAVDDDQRAGVFPGTPLTREKARSGEQSS